MGIFDTLKQGMQGLNDWRKFIGTAQPQAAQSAEQARRVGNLLNERMGIPSVPKSPGGAGIPTVPSILSYGSGANVPPMPTFTTQPVPEVAPVASTGTYSAPPPAPNPPALPPIPPPVTPTVPAPIVPGSTSPTPPPAPITPPGASPETKAASEAAYKALQDSLKLSPDEITTQEDLDKIIASARKGMTAIEGQPIAMPLITGAMAQLQKQAEDLAVPLEQKLSRLQAMRTASIESSKFALDRADKKVELETNAASEASKATESTRQFNVQQSLAEKKLAEDSARSARDYALSEKKYNEDVRQFGLKYAQDERKIQVDAQTKLGDPNAKSNEALQGYDLVNNILNGNTNAITGVPGISAFWPGTGTQYTASQVKQLNALLSLENRQKLKGSGAISDYESRVLAQSASSLGLDPNTGRSGLSNEDFKKELNKIKGVFANAAGIPAHVVVTDPNTGQSKSGTLNREEINSAISQGFNVEYK